MNPLAPLTEPVPLGSYPIEDVTFLLKDLSHLQIEKSTEEREVRIQKGAHYSEMLPIEQALSKAYYDLFYQSLEKYRDDIIRYVYILSHKLATAHGKKLVLVSLARAGTPIGVLLKRALATYFGLHIPHYAISIIIGKGLDENALRYILGRHPDAVLQFVDGWTGKGTIKGVLEQSCAQFNEKYSTKISSALAVLADPCGCAEYYGTTQDFLLPSALLNSTVSGLISRTIHREDLLGKGDFHGVKVYHENAAADVSNFFVDTLSQGFCDPLVSLSKNDANEAQQGYPSLLDWKGRAEIQQIAQAFGLPHTNLLKPGLGETTRVLLRRVPEKILVHAMEDPDLAHLFVLAREKNVPVELFPLKNYRCCGIIKNLGDV